MPSCNRPITSTRSTWPNQARLPSVGLARVSSQINFTCHPTGRSSSATARSARSPGPPRPRTGAMIRLGLRLAVSGGREAVVRLIILAAAVGLGVGLLLTVISAVNAVSVQNDRYAWLDRGAPAASGAAALGGATSRDPLWTLITTDLFNGQGIYRPMSRPPVLPHRCRRGSPRSRAGPVLHLPRARRVTAQYPDGRAGGPLPRAPGRPDRRGGPAVPRLAGHHRRAFGCADVAPAWRREADQLQHHSAERLRHS